MNKQIFWFHDHSKWKLSNPASFVDDTCKVRAVDPGGTLSGLLRGECKRTEKAGEEAAADDCQLELTDCSYCVLQMPGYLYLELRKTHLLRHNIRKKEKLSNSKEKACSPNCGDILLEHSVDIIISWRVMRLKAKEARKNRVLRTAFCPWMYHCEKLRWCIHSRLG